MGNPLRLIALIKTREVLVEILTTVHLQTELPALQPARLPRRPTGRRGGEEDLINGSRRRYQRPAGG